MYDDFYQMYLEELEAVAEAGPEEELSLLERLAAGDVSARERLIEGNLKRVLEYAKEYDGRGLPMGDLVQEGNMALTALAMEYESGAFQELLRERVRACIEAALEEQRMEAEIEENVAARVNVLQEVSRVMAKELGREATVEELAAKMKMTEDEIRDIMKVTLDAVNVGTAMRMNLDGDGNEPESDPFGLEEP
ncbi:hypothetical protein B5E84_13770 [Lachnoclostridium sp. An14]|uniref:sigma-70 domain-containing protein n=1 Tax=Lachnoclostridium sp. An14 TaxID=1965562 RepID=UPI000B38FC8E|nr:sigma-70 domain-containing protein [Lachnoclostridium sp. An14]OUQ15894.1 hypothetical protein B5E84_13770 [Lachnoclostridium sp. An14]